MYVLQKCLLASLAGTAMLSPWHRRWTVLCCAWLIGRAGTALAYALCGLCRAVDLILIITSRLRRDNVRARDNVSCRVLQLTSNRLQTLQRCEQNAQ